MVCFNVGSLSVNSHSILILEEVHKTYHEGETPVHAVRGISLEVSKGDVVALMGPSGCGKSTLLHLCGAMDRPTSGEVCLEGRRLGSLSDREMTLLRRRRIGFVFQFFNLLPTLSVLENIMLPRLLDRADERETRRRADQLIALLGLGGRLRHYPSQLSGGEMQRVALARAVVNDPALLIGDEPTGSLDSENGRLILELFQRLNRETGVTLLLATHASETAAIARRIVRMRDGRIEGMASQDAAIAPAAANQAER
jgi:putative ABC transport system ATP-binding protein